MQRRLAGEVGSAQRGNARCLSVLARAGSGGARPLGPGEPVARLQPFCRERASVPGRIAGNRAAPSRGSALCFAFALAIEMTGGSMILTYQRSAGVAATHGRGGAA